MDRGGTAGGGVAGHEPLCVAGVGERMLKSEFEKEVEVEFEGYKMPAFSCWDSYLHGIYGNYMQLPPLEKRQTQDKKVYKKE